MQIELFYQTRNGSWQSMGVATPNDTLNYSDSNVKMTFNQSQESKNIAKYNLAFEAVYPTRIKINGKTSHDNAWHLIPCCIHGDNNLANAKSGQYPNLTTLEPEAIYSSKIWEFRADRAATPVSIAISDEHELCAISIEPYTRDEENQLIRNGVFSELPNNFGVTIGYANLPCTFMNKFCTHNDGRRVSTSNPCKKSQVSGYIFNYQNSSKDQVRDIIDYLYLTMRNCPEPQKSYTTAAKAVVTAFVEQNWSEDFKHYTNQEAHPPERPNLRPWRALLEIGWTGGSILAYPFIKAMNILDLPKEFFADKKSGLELFDEIVANYNPESGMFFDLVRPLNGSRVNGWWDFLKITHDCHSAYTNGHALFYLFKAMTYLRDNGQIVNANWEEIAQKVAQTHLDLQRTDGCFGYAFSTTERKVTDFDGYAGCWIAAALAAAGEYTKQNKYYQAAAKGANFYHQAVLELNVCGTPMDTWKAPDQEGNLAFMKLVKILHEYTKDDMYLKMLEDGANYEYLWRYSFKAIPEIMPLKGSNWNSCGGSVTSVSNPHIHPMGVLVTSELLYLAQKTKHQIHYMRAMDTISWIMNSLELYPEVSGYGRYGVTTERYCPSDGLTDYHYSDGRPSSMWYSYNGWAAANTLEALLDMIEYQKNN